MENIEIDVNEAGMITITVDGTKSLGLSRSGKTILIATTHGGERVKIKDSEMFVSINVYKYPDKR